MSGDSDALIEFIASNPDALFNMERGAVQVLNCNGLVSLHLEVSGPVLAALADADL